VSLALLPSLKGTKTCRKRHQRYFPHTFGVRLLALRSEKQITEIFLKGSQPPCFLLKHGEWSKKNSFILIYFSFYLAKLIISKINKNVANGLTAAARHFLDFERSTRRPQSRVFLRKTRESQTKTYVFV